MDNKYNGIHFVSMPEEKFVAETINIVEDAQSRGIIIRILGGVAIYVHSMNMPEIMNLYKRIKRFGEDNPIFTDLDVIAYSKQSRDIEKFFEKELGFKPDFAINRLYGYRRLIFYHPKNYYHVDVFLDKLEFSHDVFFGKKPGEGRLELDFPTVTLSDIILEKLQIHDINQKDLIDLVILFAGHDIQTDFSKETVDGRYIADVLSNDWEFWYDAINNLKLVKNLAEKLDNEEKLDDEIFHRVISRVDKLMKIIDETPKTKKWVKRAKKGIKKKWWRDVEEVIR